MGAIYKRGAVYWIKYYCKGEPIRESSKSKKWADAANLLKEREGDISKGMTPGVSFEKVMFQELVQGIREDYKLKGQKRPRIKHLEKYFWGMRAVDITTTEIKGYINHRRKEGIANGTIVLELSALKRMYSIGAKESNPPKVYRVPHIPKIKVENVKQGYFEEIMFQTLREKLPDYLKGFATFGMRTGWRVNEIRSLRWNQVDMDRKSVSLEGRQTKNRKARYMALEPELILVMEQQFIEKKKGCPYVFHRDGQQIKDFRFSWNEACRESGLGYGYKSNNKYVEKWGHLGEGPTFHDFRRTAVRDMERAGIPREIAKQRTGHLTDAVYNRYNIVDEKDQINAAQRLGEYRQEQNELNEEIQPDNQKDPFLMFLLLSQMAQSRYGHNFGHNSQSRHKKGINQNG